MFLKVTFNTEEQAEELLQSLTEQAANQFEIIQKGQSNGEEANFQVTLKVEKSLYRTIQDIIKAEKQKY